MFKFLLVFLIPAAALAEPTLQQKQEFADTIATYKQSCPGNCTGTFSNKLLYSRDQRVIDPAYAAVKSQTLQVSKDQAQVWGDTILEGDYAAAGYTRTDAVTAIYNGATLVAYRVTYSEKGWDTSTCAYDGHRESLKDCTIGRISESSFTMPQFEYDLADEDAYATFTPTVPAPTPAPSAP